MTLNEWKQVIKLIYKFVFQMQNEPIYAYYLKS